MNVAFLPLQQVILAASDQSAEGTIILPLPSPPRRTDYLSFTSQSNCFDLKGDKYYRKHEGKQIAKLFCSASSMFFIQ